MCHRDCGTGPEGRGFAAALLPRLFEKNPRSHHKGAACRVRTGDQRLPHWTIPRADSDPRQKYSPDFVQHQISKKTKNLYQKTGFRYIPVMGRNDIVNQSEKPMPGAYQTTGLYLRNECVLDPLGFVEKHIPTSRKLSCGPGPKLSAVGYEGQQVQILSVKRSSPYPRHRLKNHYDEETLHPKEDASLEPQSVWTKPDFHSKETRDQSENWFYALQEAIATLEAIQIVGNTSRYRSRGIIKRL